MSLYQSKYSVDPREKLANFENLIGRLDEEESGVIYADNADQADVSEKEYNKVLKQRTRKGTLAENKTKSGISQPIVNFNVSKYMDFQQVLKDNFYNFEQKRSVQSLQTNKKQHIPLDKNYKIQKKHDKTKYTTKDQIFYKNREVKMTNSIVFYLNHFYGKSEYFNFNTTSENTQPMTVSFYSFLARIPKQSMSILQKKLRVFSRISNQSSILV